MKTKIIALFFSLLGLCSASVTPNAPYVYTVGTATLSAKADTAVIPFRIIERNEDLAAAMESMKTKCDKVFLMLAEEKIEARDIVSYKVDIHQETDREKTQKVVGFRVTREFRVTLRDLQRFARMAEKITQITAGELSAARFSSSKWEDLKNQCEEMAIDDARKHAERIAAKSGAKLGQVHAVSPIPFGDIDDEFLPNEFRRESGYFRQPVQPPAPPKFDIIIPEIEVTASVHVIFTLISK